FPIRVIVFSNISASLQIRVVFFEITQLPCKFVSVFFGITQLPCKFVSCFLKTLSYLANSCQVFWNHSAALRIRVRFFEITQLPCKFVPGFLKSLSFPAISCQVFPGKLASLQFPSIGASTSNVFSYTVRRRSSQKLVTSGAGPLRVGSVHV